MDNTLLDDVHELVLDGQQRLTSLLQALTVQSERRFFIEVSGFSSDSMQMVDIICEGNQTTKGRKLQNPKYAYQYNLIPMDVLLDDTDDDGLTALARWCTDVGDDVGIVKSRVLETRISKFVNENFFERLVWYCWLPESTDRADATEIFVETNTSSVRIKRFDIEVANARGYDDADFRYLIQDAFESQENYILTHYFKQDPEDWIPDIGEWMLKIACLLFINEEEPDPQIPREKNYEKGLRFLFKQNETGEFPNFDKMFGYIAETLSYAGEMGAATRRTLPSWPPLHVIAALQPTLKQIGDPTRINTARKLLNAYYWRCLFSNRYDAQANIRLHEDFKSLRDALNGIRDYGISSGTLQFFNNDDHPLYNEIYLRRNAKWIGTTSRLGRALASIAMSEKPPDWITGEELTPDKIRRLEQSRSLDRHHVFSRDALNRENVSREDINNGLNGVILDGRTNRRFAKEPPERYLKKVIEAPESNITEEELRDRIKKHFVPYDEMNGAMSIRNRYEEFLKKRAKILSEEIKRRGELPQE